MEYNKVLTVLLIDYEKSIEWGNVMPYYKNGKKEGIVIWPKYRYERSLEALENAFYSKASIPRALYVISST